MSAHVFHFTGGIKGLAGSFAGRCFVLNSIVLVFFAGLIAGIGVDRSEHFKFVIQEDAHGFQNHT